MMNKWWLTGLAFSLAVLSGCTYFGPCLDGSGPVISEQRGNVDFTGVVNTGSFDLYITRADNFSVEVRAQENLLPIIETYVSGSSLIVETENDVCYRSGSPVEVHISMPRTELLRLTGSGRVFADVLDSPEAEISNSGSGNMEISSTVAESFFVENSGSGSIEVDESVAGQADMIQSGSGTILLGSLSGAGVVHIRHSSSGRISAVILDVAELDIRLSGSGRVELGGYGEFGEYSLHSSGRIDAFDMEMAEVDATNSGSGDIYVWASDLLEATITGSGDIVFMGNPAITSSISGSGKLRAY